MGKLKCSSKKCRGKIVFSIPRGPGYLPLRFCEKHAVQFGLIRTDIKMTVFPTPRSDTEIRGPGRITNSLGTLQIIHIEGKKGSLGTKKGENRK